MSRSYCPTKNTKCRRPTTLNPCPSSAAGQRWPNWLRTAQTSVQPEHRQSPVGTHVWSWVGPPARLHHPDNPPANPELLRVLAEHFVAMNYDMQKFLREIALSNAYQRSFDPPPELLCLSKQASEALAQFQEQRASLEAVAASADAYATAANMGRSRSHDAAGRGRARHGPQPVRGSKKEVDEAVKAVTDAANQLQAKKTVADPLQQAATAAQEVVKKLPDDKELADAAQKFAARSSNWLPKQPP